MPRADVLDELIRTLDPENVPLEFVVMAKATDFSGRERIIKGEELERILSDPERYQIAEVRVIYNVKKMRKVILDEVEAVYDEVRRRFAAKMG